MQHPRVFWRAAPVAGALRGFHRALAVRERISPTGANDGNDTILLRTG